MNQPNTKKCTKCNILLPLNCFAINGARLRSRCKNCSRKQGVKPQNKVINGFKICSKCHLLKKITEYSKRKDRVSGIMSFCKMCDKKRSLNPHRLSLLKKSSQKNYLKNRDIYLMKLKNKDMIIMNYLNSLKNKPCTDCQQFFPAECMDFDHIVERGQKKFILSKARRRSIQKINEEIAKCELVCSNCHRIRTKKRNTKH